MPKKKSTVSSMAGVPPETDDLKLINGIGPVIESRLNKVGIFTFAQLTMLSPADIAEAVSAMIGLSAQQISAQDWIGQAHKLSSQAAELKHQRTDAKEENLLEAIPVNESPSPATNEIDAAVSSVEETTPPLVGETRENPLTDREKVPPFREQTEAASHANEETGRSFAKQAKSTPLAAQETALPIDLKPEPVDALNLQKLEILPHGADHHRHVLLSEQLFDVRLTLDWDMTALTGDPLDYTVSLFVKKLGVQDYRGRIGEARGTVVPAKSVLVKVENIALPQGTYRLDAHVILRSATGSSETSPGSLMLKKSHILHLI